MAVAQWLESECSLKQRDIRQHMSVVMRVRLPPAEIRFNNHRRNEKMSEKGIHIHNFQDGNDAVVVEFGFGKIGILVGASFGGCEFKTRRG